MGFFSNVGEALFGTKTKKAAAETQAKAVKQTEAVGEAAAKYGQQFADKRRFYDEATLNSMGGNAADYMDKAGTTSSKETARESKEALSQGLNTARLQEQNANAYGKATAADQTAEARKSGLDTAKAISSAAQAQGLSAAEEQQLAAQESASKLAEQQGQSAATQGTKAAMQAARSAGLSKGQAALTSGQQAGDIYTNNYQQGLQQGIQNYNQSAAQNIANYQQAAQQGSAQNLAARQQATSENLAATQQATAAYQQGLQQNIANYGQATSQIAAQGAEMAGRQQGALNTQMGAATGAANIAQNQTTNAQNKTAQTWGTIGTVAGTVAGMLSDENAKQNIQEVDKDNAISKVENAADTAASKSTSSVPAVSAPAVISAPVSTQTNAKTGFDVNSLKSMLGSVGSFSAPSASNASANTTTSSTQSVSAPMKEDTTAQNINAGISLGKTLSNSDKVDTILKAIPAIASMVGGKMSDWNAKQNIQEVGKKKYNYQEMTNNLNNYLKTAEPTSSLGSGLKTGMGIGTAIKGMDIFNKNKTETNPSDKLSDKNSKINVSDIIDIKDIAKKVRPVKFEYRPEIVAEGKAEPGEHLGVIAQDLEKTALKSAVHEGDDGLKRIDISELSPAILNLVIQLARKVDKLEGDK